MLWQMRSDHFRGTVCSVARHFGKVMVGACCDFQRDYYKNLTDVVILARESLRGHWLHVVGSSANPTRLSI